MGNVLNNILTANTGVSFLRSFSMELLILLGGVTSRSKSTKARGWILEEIVWV
jgi:hypothetical protein